jgi:MSHA biogenesis protein MshJ
MMNQPLNSASIYINALSLRERILVLLVFVTVIFMIWDGLLQTKFDQEYVRLQNIQQQQQQQRQAQDKQLEKNTAFLLEKNRINKQKNQNITETKQQLKQTQIQLDNVFETLVPPNKITELLRSLLLETNGLMLVSLSNEPANNITPDSADGTDKKQATTSLYQHTEIIKLSGNYQQLYQYLSALEQSKWGLFWEQLHYKVTEYPIAEITLQVHTISTDEHWIGM